MDTIKSTDWKSVAEKIFNNIKKEIKTYNIKTHPELTVEYGFGFVSHYDPKLVKIFISIPYEQNNPLADFFYLYYENLLADIPKKHHCRLITFFLHVVIAHELGHHLRDFYGFLTKNFWQEEHIATKFSSAIVKRKISPAERNLISKWIDTVFTKFKKDTEKTRASAVVLNIDLIESLNIFGVISPLERNILSEILNESTIDDELFFKKTNLFPTDIQNIVDNRELNIKNFNKVYAKEIKKYSLTHLIWFKIMIKSSENEYLSLLAIKYLGFSNKFLPKPQYDQLSSKHILSTYQAFKQTQHAHNYLSLYFKKGYYVLFLKRASSLIEKKFKIHLSSDYIDKLIFDLSQHEGNLLTFIANLFPGKLLQYLPDKLERAYASAKQPLCFSSDTDKQLWRSIKSPASEEAIKNSIQFLKIIEKVPLFRYFSNTLLFELSSILFKVVFPKGSVVIWEKDTDRDIFILIKGRLGVYVLKERRNIKVAEIKPGQFFGEMNYFTCQPRSSQIIAETAATCFVIKASLFTKFILQKPVMLIYMTQAISVRLQRMNKLMSKN